MTSISPSPVPSAPHVSLARSSASTSSATLPRASVVPPTRRANVTSPTSPTSPTARPSLPGAPSKRFSTIQSKVGSLEAIHYKPKPSEKKIQSFKQDFSHIKSKVDAKLVILPSESGEVQKTAGASSVATAAGSRGGSVKRPTVVTTTATATGATRTTSRQPLSPPPSRTSSAVRTATPAVISTSAAAATTTTTTTTTPTSPRSPPHSRRSSNVSTTTSPPLSPSSPNSGSANSRRLSKHIIPTQKAQYDHVKSKVGSFDNVAYKESGRGRPSSRASSSGAFSPGNGRSRSPSGARSSNSSNGGSTAASTTSTAQRRLSAGGSSGFKIPPSKKVDYSNVRSKVGSREFINHTPQGGNLRVFSEKLSFRETAQSKIAREINITQFYQNEDQSFDTSIQEEHEGEAVEGQDNGDAVTGQYSLDQEESVIYGSDAGADDFEPPKNILAVLAEVTESVGEIGLGEAHS